ncbi:MAG: type II toxin-antitoxin system PemK/MazF family toxin [Acetobacteraceae bacterium]
MPLPNPVPGLVISYAYLWRDQQDQGREEGVKDRPCVVVLAVRQEEGERIVTVAPITHTPPRHAKDAIELPAATKRRLGLDDDRSWIVATELNRFLWPGPDLRPVPGKPGQFAYGGLPRQLMVQLRERIAELHRDRRFRMVRRDHDGDEHER